MDAKLNLPNRAAGDNLIEGSLSEVVALLDSLSGIQPDNDAVFRKTSQLMWKRRRNQLASQDGEAAKDVSDMKGGLFPKEQSPGLPNN